MLLAAAPARAANHRVAIGNYQWSMPLIHLDRGEHVTWYWVGPDTMHSVTGVSPNDAGLDSDAGVNTPDHTIGDSFRLSFNQPGTYDFQCKLHSGVRGTIVVSSAPGDPTTEVDPVPESNVDLNAPHVDELRVAERAFGRRGTTLRFGIDETATVDAEYYRLRRGGHRRFAGWHSWGAHVGYNDVGFGGASKHFHPRPGRYEAVIRASDTSHNTARPKVRRFTIGSGAAG